MENPTLRAALKDYVRAARAARPDVAVDDAEFEHHILARAQGGRLPALAHAGDLLLACACSGGRAVAIQAFQQAYAGVIARVLSRRRARAAEADDAMQTVYERLLVAPPGKPPKIAEYRGDGPLKNWVSTATAMTLLMMRRAAGRRREDPGKSQELLALVTSGNPELDVMKCHYGSLLKDAILLAIARLTDRERTLLHLSLGQGLSIDQLGEMYRVNRATAARWLAAAKASLIAGARDELCARLRLSESECAEILALVQSQFQLSIVRRLT